MKRKKRSLAAKMISIMVVICIVGVAAIVTTGTILSGNSVFQETLDKVQNSTAVKAEDIESWVTSETAYLDSIDHSLAFITDQSKDNMQNIFNSYVQAHPIYYSLYTGMPDGSAVFNDGWIPGAGWVPSDREWYKGAAADKSSVYISSVYTDAESGKLCTSISKAIIDESTGEFKGVLSADIFIDDITKMVIETNIAKGSYAFVADAQGNILMHPDANYQPVYDAANDTDTFKNLSTVDNGSLANMWRESTQSGDPVKAVGPDGIAKFYTMAAIPSTGWIMYIAVPTSVIYAPVYQLLYVTVPICLVLLIILVIVAVSIVKSIDKVLKQAAVQLQQSTGDIINTAAELTETSNNLAQSGSQQAASIEETSATMNQTASMVEQNTRSTHHALTLTKETSEETSNGAQKISSLINFMDELSKSSHAISNVINTISGIASQTNILALNASVESARAGEAGKAFSVVSEEVRALAQKCNDAVRSTSEIIENNARLTELSIDNSHEVSRAFDAISNKIDKVNQIMEEITTASEEQSKGVKYVNETLSQMEKLTQSNAAISEESAAAATELKSQSDILQELTDNLNRLVGHDYSQTDEIQTKSAGARQFNTNSPLAMNER
ncbi:MAG: methyl-accepting chemotaxis protein [Oscillospiraceae bacterium]|nr:methyl-accepting chemotaxis protein [Oscillospiraceae bacterium]